MARRPYDRGWILAFVATLFAIHVGRMQAEWTLVGLLGPIVAVAGDLASALLIAFGVIGPARLGFRQLTWPLERRFWCRVVGSRRVDAARAGGSTALLRPWLTRRLRIWIRFRQTRYSLPFAIERATPDGPADRRRGRGDGSDLGDELVLQLRELGRRDLQLLGRAADRHLAVRHGPCGPSRRVGARIRRAPSLSARRGSRATLRSW